MFNMQSPSHSCSRSNRSRQYRWHVSSYTSIWALFRRRVCYTFGHELLLLIFLNDNTSTVIINTMYIFNITYIFRKLFIGAKMRPKCDLPSTGQILYYYTFQRSRTLVSWSSWKLARAIKKILFSPYLSLFPQGYLWWNRLFDLRIQEQRISKSFDPKDTL